MLLMGNGQNQGCLLAKVKRRFVVVEGQIVDAAKGGEDVQDVLLLGG